LLLDSDFRARPILPARSVTQPARLPPDIGAASRLCRNGYGAAPHHRRSAATPQEM